MKSATWAWAAMARRFRNILDLNFVAAGECPPFAEHPTDVLFDPGRINDEKIIILADAIA